MTNISKIIIAGTLAALSTTGAVAQPDEPRSITVQHADLDLSSEAGQKTLRIRVQRAAHFVCSTGNERLNLGAQRASNKCRQDAVAKALTSLGITKATEIAVASPSE